MSFPIVLLAAVSCLPYYFKYEKKKPQTREHVVLAVMTALTVISRMIFAPLLGENRDFSAALSARLYPTSFSDRVRGRRFR